MNKKTLTPVQLWKDFDNNCCPLDMSVVGYSCQDNINIIDYFFTALKVEDGDVRVYARSYAQKGTYNNPTLLIIERFFHGIDTQIVNHFVAQGYTVVTFDYKGDIGNHQSHTFYPNSLEYGNILKSDGHLTSAKEGVENTCLFLWAKITRRVITLIENLSICDKDKISALANDTAFNILAQAGGTDQRIKAIISVRNNGFSKFNANKENVEFESVLEELELNRWIIGCSAPSYIKFITYPIIYFASTNDREYDIMNMKDFLALTPQDTPRYLSISTGTDGCLYNSFLPTASNVLNGIINHKPITNPTIEYEIDDNKLYFNVTVDHTYDHIDHIELAVSHGEISSKLRNWHRYSVHVGLNGKCKVPAKVFSNDEEIYAFLTIQYTNGVMLSTPITTIIPDEYAGKVKKNIPNNRIIYENKLGTLPFFLTSNDITIDQNHVRMSKGALDINGITTDYGELICYKIGDIKGKKDDSILQFDCYSKIDKEITVKLTDENLVEYSAIISVKASEKWERFSLEVNDFKDSNLMTLKTLENIKVLSFVNAENILLNNIIWI